MMEKAGFDKNEIYYPVPDYKMPLEICSPEHLPGSEALGDRSPAYDRPRLVLFNEGEAAMSLKKDGLYEEFANSFLVISRKNS